MRRAPPSPARSTGHAAGRCASSELAPGGEQGVLHAPFDEELLELIEREALADAAEIDLAAGFLAGDGRRHPG